MKIIIRLLGKNVVLIALVSCVLYGCRLKNSEITQQSIKIANSELYGIKKILLDEFSEHDASECWHDSLKAIGLFKDYLFSSNWEKYNSPYYNEIVDGLSLKFFYCEPLEHPFFIIRTLQNSFYYFSLIDHFRYDKFLKFEERNNRLELVGCDTLFVINDTLSIEASNLQRILNSDSLVFKNKYSPQSGFTISKLIKKLYSGLQFSNLNSQNLTYEIYPSLLSDELLSMYKSSIDTNNLYRIEAKLKNIGIINSHKVIMRIKNYGIIVYNISTDYNKFRAEKYFIPELKKNKHYKI